MTASAVLGDFIAALDVDAVEQALIAKVKDHLLDTIGVICAGLADPQAREVSGVVQRWGGHPEAAVIGLATRLPAPKAAFLNTLHGRINTFDDTHEAGPSHPGSAVVSAGAGRRRNRASVGPHVAVGAARGL